MLTMLMMSLIVSCGSDNDNNGEEERTDLSQMYREKLHCSWLLINIFENGESTISEKYLTGEDTLVVTFYENNNYQEDHSGLYYEGKRVRSIDRKGNYLFYNRGLFSDKDEYVLKKTFDYSMFGKTYTSTLEYIVSFDNNYTRLILDQVRDDKKTYKLIYDKIEWIPIKSPYDN